MEIGNKFYEKVMTKRPALHTDKDFIRNGFLVCKLGYSRKKMGVEDILF